MAKIKVYSRSREGDTWDKMKTFIPDEIECARVWGYDSWRGALYYLLDILNSDNDYIVNVDIDCFIYDWSIVNQIVSQLDESTMVFAGMPDNCENSHHRFGNYNQTNPFFNLFKVKECRRIVNQMSMDELNSFEKEPFEKLFEKLFEYGRLDLKGKTHSDGISTILANSMIHTWYSRDAEHQPRIETRFQESLQLWKKNKAL